jgi:L-asparaginase II
VTAEPGPPRQPAGGADDAQTPTIDGHALVEVVRSGFVECVHRGSVVALDAHGGVVVKIGEPDAPHLPRSANKPLQLVGMVRAGLDLAPPDLAVAASSHSGETAHVRRVRDLLNRNSLPESSLACPPALPLGEQAAWAVLAAGGGPARAFMNCSGKHTAMVLTCVANGWPVPGYVKPDHPLQVAIRGAVEELAGEPVSAVAVDGCGAPLFGLTLTGLARAFARLVTAEPGSPERRVADAMRAHPDLVGGTGRDVTALMAGAPGVLAKDGAEGVYAAALPDGAAVAVKIADGAERARRPVLVAALRRLGLAAPVLDELAEVPVLGGGRPVGTARLRAGALG